MDENLVGYLLKALDTETYRDVVTYLREQPEAQKRLETLRRALAPLAADDEDVDPPKDLWIRTLATIAEYRCRDLPRAPAPPPVAKPPAPPRSWWRRADVLVAAGLLLCLTLLTPPALNYYWHHHNILACQDNLRRFYQALESYGERNQGRLPQLELQPPFNVAAVFIPILHEAGLLQDPMIKLTCTPGAQPPPLRRTLQELRTLSREEFDRYADSLGCYAYSLGYFDASGYHQLRLDPNQPDLMKRLAILADRPPAGKGYSLVGPGNSPNHNGRGQNVLFLDGHIRFCKVRTVGVGGDDIYVNRNKQVAAGLDREDTVLGASTARPW
jgi:prepilin-type processing-associated H-X9-DG protein